MRSPFPGMDPYLEARWNNLRVLLIAFVTGALNRALPNDLVARPEEEWFFIDDEDSVVLRDIRIVDWQRGDRIVTRVEFVSPWDKADGPLNRGYRRRYRDAGRNGVNWVEVDLLRGSRERMPVTGDQLPMNGRGDYLILTRRGSGSQISAYPISIRQRLPIFAVPLRDGEPDVPLDLQTAFDQAYGLGCFRSVDYTRPPTPPLSAADAEWAARLIR